MFLLMGCKTKNTLKNTEVNKEFQKTETKKDSIENVSKSQEKEATKGVLQSEKKKETQTDVEIKGKAETNKPIEMYNIENGDTLQTIKVTGNAEVRIRTKTSNLDQVKKESSQETISEKLKDFSENIVRENNVKQRVEEFKQKSKKITTHGFQAGVWIIITVIAIILILTFFTYKYFRK